MKKVFNIIFISLILATILNTMSFAGSSFDTFPGGSTKDPNAAKPGAWAFRPVTGTRYVFRVNGEDIGGDESQNYYINHVRNTTVNSGGLTYYNPTEAQEKKGVRNDRNWEMVYVGTNTNNTYVLKEIKRSIISLMSHLHLWLLIKVNIDILSFGPEETMEVNFI